ncbi:hypothetical protein BHE74_00019710 [Ensete ventricosum]|nr:hypothetical protein GW17_00061462 [Ensete ventricosum]RWW72503.1 hypothetical protein BHE74_00019710 [Ensete ventricosum]
MRGSRPRPGTCRGGRMRPGCRSNRLQPARRGATPTEASSAGTMPARQPTREVLPKGSGACLRGSRPWIGWPP